MHEYGIYIWEMEGMDATNGELKAEWKVNRCCMGNS
jgi:hypothetical protein